MIATAYQCLSLLPHASPGPDGSPTRREASVLNLSIGSEHNGVTLAVIPDTTMFLSISWGPKAEASPQNLQAIKLGHHRDDGIPIRTSLSVLTRADAPRSSRLDLRSLKSKASFVNLPKSRFNFVLGPLKGGGI